MDQRSLLEFMTIAEKLKCNLRHSCTSSGRPESVAEHTFRLIMFAWLVEDAFPEFDSDRIMKMCLLHDMGEAVTGDVPAFEKKEEDRMTEKDAIYQIAEVLPDKKRKEFLMLLEELEASETMEAHPYLERLRELIRQDTLDKIDAAVDEALDEQMGLQDKKGFL